MGGSGAAVLQGKGRSPIAAAGEAHSSRIFLAFLSRGCSWPPAAALLRPSPLSPAHTKANICAGPQWQKFPCLKPSAACRPSGVAMGCRRGVLAAGVPSHRRPRVLRAARSGQGLGQGSSLGKAKLLSRGVGLLSAPAEGEHPEGHFAAASKPLPSGPWTFKHHFTAIVGLYTTLGATPLSDPVLFAPTCVQPKRDKPGEGQGARLRGMSWVFQSFSQASRREPPAEPRNTASWEEQQ